MRGGCLISRFECKGFGDVLIISFGSRYQVYLTLQVFQASSPISYFGMDGCRF